MLNEENAETPIAKKSRPELEMGNEIMRELFFHAASFSVFPSSCSLFSMYRKKIPFIFFFLFLSLARPTSLAFHRLEQKGEEEKGKGEGNALFISATEWGGEGKAEGDVDDDSAKFANTWIWPICTCI